MNAKHVVSMLLTAIFIIIAAAYVFIHSQLFGNILFLLPPLLAVLCGLYAVRTYRFANVHGKSIALLTAGLLCFLIGELLFFLFQFVFHTSPFPSVADIFYLAAYPLLLAGLLREIVLHNVSWRDLSKLVLLLVLLLISALVFIVLYFGVFQAYNSGDPAINNVVSIAYGIADLMLIIPSLFILNMALDYRGGKLFNSWVLLLLALICMLAGDILFAIFKHQYTLLTRPYTLIDLLWVASYLLFAYSFFYTATTIRELDAKLLE